MDALATVAFDAYGEGAVEHLACLERWAREARRLLLPSRAAAGGDAAGEVVTLPPLRQGESTGQVVLLPALPAATGCEPAATAIAAA